MSINEEHHKRYPDEYEAGHLDAVGALIGTCYGRGEEPPFMTEVLKEALEHMTAAAFNAGVKVGLRVVI
jgi:small ligand-binding sensory domain FIST